MTVIAIPKSLRERLGDEGSDALVEVISAIDNRAREDSLRLLEERFERRLTEEIGKVNQRLTEEIGKVNQRLTEEIGKVNQRLTEEIGSLRTEMHSEIQGIRTEMYKIRAELIKWMFIFWIGQITILGGLMISLFTFFTP